MGADGISVKAPGYSCSTTQRQEEKKDEVFIWRNIWHVGTENKQISQAGFPWVTIEINFRVDLKVSK